MTKEEIEEGNKLIADFMNATIDEYPKSLPKWFEHWGNLNPSDMQYHSSWDWLMPVVEKIEGDRERQFNIRNTSAWINGGNMFGTYVAESKIESVYKTIINFIKWHKNQTTNK